MYEKSLQMDYSIFTCCKCFLGNDKLSTKIEVPSDKTAQQM